MKIICRMYNPMNKNPFITNKRPKLNQSYWGPLRYLNGERQQTNGVAKLAGDLSENNRRVN